MNARAFAAGVIVSASLVLFVGSVAAASEPGLKPGRYKIDPRHTYAHFRIDHMGLSIMQGRMDAQGGTLRVGNPPSNSRISVTLDPVSVDTGNEARDKHLREMDGFFNVDKYPSIEFKSTSIQIDDDDPAEATVKGKLTLHGTTRLVTLDVDDIACRVNPLENSHYTCGFTASTEIRRSDFDMNAYPKLVGDQVELSIEVEANKSIGGDS